ncbi:hypothetical protein N9018_05075, partial [Rhodopirellula sp.]|nr:hypothetical protein [Rhodopirellula sp.]
MTTKLTDHVLQAILQSSRMLLLAFLSLFSVLSGVARAVETAEVRVDFAREVLPVLSNKCFVCHGPDSHDDTDLRLDS